MGLILLLVSLVVGYCLVKTYLGLKDPLLLFVGSVLAGILVSAPVLYLLDLLFVAAFHHYTLSNGVFLAAASILIAWSLRRQGLLRELRDEAAGLRRDKAGLVMLLLAALFSAWLFYQAFRPRGGDIVDLNCWSDHLYHTAYIRSVSIGRNIPIERPYFANEAVNYHFLFDYFCGKITQMGLHSVHALNIMSILGMTALLLLIFAWGRFYFHSAAAGVLGAIFLILHSSMSGLAWLQANLHGTDVLARIVGKTGWLQGAQFENWGLFNLGVFQAQRHFPFALAVLLLVVLVVWQDREAPAPEGKEAGPWARRLFLGFIIGLLPFWHIVVAFIAIIIVASFGLTGLKKKGYPIGILAGVLTALAMVVPQYLLFRSGGTVLTGYPKIFFGYGAEQRTLAAIGHYYLRVLGVKPLVLATALMLMPWKRRFDLLILSIPFLLGNILQFGPVLYDNNKLLLISLVFLNCYAGYAVILLYRAARERLGLLALACPVLLCFMLTFAGVLDLFSTANQRTMIVADRSSPLVQWVAGETDPRAVFLTNPEMPHYDTAITSLRLAGRRFYLLLNNNDQSDKKARFEIAQTIYTFAGDPDYIKALIRKEKIDYVVVDDWLRESASFPLNEQAIAGNLRLRYHSKETDVYSL